MPTYDGLNEADIFLDAFEREVLEKQCFQELDWALHTVPTWWWGMHNESFDNWRECRRMMCTHFGKPKMRLTNKYDGRDDLCAHLAKLTKVYGGKPQLEWVHMFYHTLDVIPMN